MHSRSLHACRFLHRALTSWVTLWKNQLRSYEKRRTGRISTWTQPECYGEPNCSLHTAVGYDTLTSNKWFRISLHHIFNHIKIPGNLGTCAACIPLHILVRIGRIFLGDIPSPKAKRTWKQMFCRTHVFSHTQKTTTTMCVGKTTHVGSHL